MAEDYSSGGWIAFFILLATVILGLVVYSVRTFLLRDVGLSSGESTIGLMFSGLFKIVLNIIPISLFGFGIVADVIRTEVRASIPTLGAFFTLLLAKFATSFYQSNFPLFADQSALNTNDYWCSLPGLEFIDNPLFPSSVLSTTIIAFYYIWWAIGTPKQTVILAYMITAFSASIVQFTFGKCANYYYPIIPLGRGIGVMLQTILLGLGISGFLYGLIWGVYRSLDPLAGLYIPGNYVGAGPSGPSSMSGKASCPSGTYDDGSGNCVGPTPNPTCPVGRKWFEADSIGPAGCRCPNGTLPDSTGSCPYASNQTSAPSGSEQTFVAELYKNGQLVTDSISK